MSIREILSSEHSRSATNTILSMIHNDHSLLSDLMECFLDNDLRICQRAAWPVGDLGEKFPTLISPYLPQLIAALEHPKHDAIVRNTVRTWQNMPIPEAYQGKVYEICFQYIIEPKVAIAIRAFSMTVCAQICKQIPELADELILAIEDQMENGSAGICSRGRRVIKMLRSELNILS